MRVRYAGTLIADFCAFYGLVDIIEKGIKKKNPLLVCLGCIGAPLIWIAMYFAILESKVALLEKKNEEKED